MISLVIPFYNEEKRIADTARRAVDYLSTHFRDYELLLVNDGSTDASAAAVVPLCGDRVKLLGYPQNCGKGRAVKTGMLAAKGDAVFFLDADLAYGLEVLKPAFERLMGGDADILVGSRRLDEQGYSRYPLVRRVASHGFAFVVNTLLGLHVTDSQCGFKGFKREAARKVFSRCRIDGFAFDMEALYIARDLGLKIIEQPVRVLVHGDSKVRVVRDSLRMFRDVLYVRRSTKRGKGHEQA